MMSRISRILLDTALQRSCIRIPVLSLSTVDMSSKKFTQTNLPRLPVPPLHPSLKKYLLSVQPLLSEEEFANTKMVVKNFGAPNGIGVILHNMLQERAKITDNWLDEWWLQKSYLEYRMPVIVYSSPGLVFPIKEFTSQEQQLEYAARLIAGALKYKLLIDQNTLPEESMGGNPLDMSQHSKIFSTCRIPGAPSDSLIHSSLDPVPPRHIVVAHNNQYFSIDVYAEDGIPLNESQLLSQLQLAVNQSREAVLPVGILTTQHRDTWAAAYKRLKKYDSTNKESIQVIQRSIFLVCLDKACPEKGALNRKTHVALQTIHGGGGDANSGNRWYDKTIQFIIGADGAVGLTYEHSPAEGPAITSMMDYICDYIEKTKGSSLSPNTGTIEPKRLPFKLSPETLGDIRTAENDLNVILQDLEMSCFTYGTYGKEFIKSQKLSPDSFIQMAIQLAFYKIHNQIAATYESGSLRKFLYGRTETIRSASMEALTFCETMLNKSAKPYDKAVSLRTAIGSHKDYTLSAINGMGVDRMLLGLKLLAIENGMNIPELFLDAGYVTSTHFKLSTSQVPAKVDAFMCYGPLVPNGYGCCYNPRANSINFGLSACNSSPETNSSDFMNSLAESLTSMHEVLAQSQVSKL